MAATESDSAALANALNALTKEIKGLREDVKSLKTELKRQQAANTQPRPARSVSLEGKEIQIGNHPAMGSDTAKIAIVEFSDYQCPFCRSFFQRTFPAIKRKMVDSGKVKFVYFDYPLTFHPHAEGAAVAARCAGEQNKYWSMHDRLFLYQRRLGDQLYSEQAKAMGLNMKEFSKCLAGPEQKTKINESLALGSQLGITGTPAFFIGKLDGGVVKDLHVVVGAKPYSYFSSTVAALER